MIQNLALPRRHAKNRSGVNLIRVGSMIIAAILIASILAPWLSRWSPTEIDFAAFLVGPTASHLLGTDGNGMDIWSRIVHGARLDLGIGLTSVLFSVVIGGTFGGVVGYLGGWIEAVAMRITDVMQAFPPFILALTVSAMFGRDFIHLTFAIGLVFMPAYIRLMRSEIRTVRERAFIEAAECAGNSTTRLLFRHLFPNAMRPLLVIAPLNCGWAMLTLAGLSFLGLAVPIPQAEWGAMISTGAVDVVGGRWWTSVFPGAALFISVLGFNLIGEGLLERTNLRR